MHGIKMTRDNKTDGIGSINTKTHLTRKYWNNNLENIQNIKLHTESIACLLSVSKNIR